MLSFFLEIFVAQFLHNTLLSGKNVSFLEPQNCPRAAGNTFTTCKAMAVENGNIQPGMTANVDPNRTIIGAYPTLDAPCRIGYDLPFHNDLPPGIFRCEFISNPHVIDL